MAKIIDKEFAKPGDRIFSSGWTTSTPLILNRSTKGSQKSTTGKPKLVASNQNPKPVSRDELDRRQLAADMKDELEAQNRRERLLAKQASGPVKNEDME